MKTVAEVETILRGMIEKLLEAGELVVPHSSGLIVAEGVNHNGEFLSRSGGSWRSAWASEGACLLGVVTIFHPTTDQVTYRGPIHNAATVLDIEDDAAAQIEAGFEGWDREYAQDDWYNLGKRLREDYYLRDGKEQS